MYTPPQALVILKQLAERTKGFEIKHICETGFFRDGSSLFWMLIFPDAILNTFDIKISPEASKFLDTLFPGRIFFHEGPSKETVCCKSWIV